MEGFFSWRKGWLVYTPIMVISLIGLLLRKRIKSWHTAIVLFTLVNIYVVLSWHMWWYAGSFGQRALVQSYAVLAIPMAAVFSIASKRRWSSVGLGFFVVACILLNQWQHYQYRHKILPQDGITKTFYKASFSKGTLDKTLRRYLNNDEMAPAHLSPGRALAAYTYEGDTGLGDLTVGSHRPYSPTLQLSTTELPPPGSWVRVTASLEASSDRFGQYDGAKLVAEVKRNNNAHKWTGIEVQKIIEPDSKQTVHFDYQLPALLSDSALLQVMLWNQSPDSIYLSELRVEALE